MGAIRGVDGSFGGGETPPVYQDPMSEPNRVCLMRTGKRIVTRAGCLRRNHDRLASVEIVAMLAIAVMHMFIWHLWLLASYLAADVPGSKLRPVFQRDLFRVPRSCILVSSVLRLHFSSSDMHGALSDCQFTSCNAQVERKQKVSQDCVLAARAMTQRHTVTVSSNIYIWRRINNCECYRCVISCCQPIGCTAAKIHSAAATVGYVKLFDMLIITEASFTTDCTSRMHKDVASWRQIQCLMRYGFMYLRTVVDINRAVMSA